MEPLPGLISIAGRREYATAPRTLLVLGQARGGTSLAAGLLYHLGISMGSQCDRPIYEDGLLTRQIRTGKTGLIKQTIQTYDDRWSCWGYKQPSAQHFLMKKYAWFRNPVFIFIVKDPASIALRREALRDCDALEAMHRALKNYERTLKLIRKQRAPALILSYEKLLKSPERLTPAIVEALGIRGLHTARGIDYLKEGGNAYQVFFDNQLLRKKHRVEGHIDQITATHIEGWAMAADSAKPLTIKIIRNGEPLTNLEADVYREDLKVQLGHPTGLCGYRAILDNLQPLSPGDVIRAFAGPQEVELSRSPWLVE